MAEAASKTTFPEGQSSAHKRALQNRKKNLQNRAHRSQIQTSKLICLEEPEKAKEELKNFHKLVDKAQKKGFFHPNKVARLKSRLSKKV